MMAVSYCSAIWLRMRITANARSLSSGAVGSSARITGGRLTSARAIETRCCSPPESCVSAHCFRKDTPYFRHLPAGSSIYFRRPANFPPYSTQDSMLFGSGFQRHRRPPSITWNPAASSCPWIILTDSPLQP